MRGDPSGLPSGAHQEGGGAVLVPLNATWVAQCMVPCAPVHLPVLAAPWLAGTVFKKLLFEEEFLFMVQGKKEILTGISSQALKLSKNKEKGQKCSLVWMN